MAVGKPTSRHYLPGISFPNLSYPLRMEPHDTAGHAQAGLTVSQRLAAAIGRPMARPLSETERADLERRQDEADAGAERLYGIRGAAA